jgi:hypothetical protein
MEEEEKTGKKYMNDHTIELCYTNSTNPSKCAYLWVMMLLIVNIMSGYHATGAMQYKDQEC